MSGDDRYRRDNQGDREHPDEPREMPASLIFTEMMRRAASQRAADAQPPEPEAPPEPEPDPLSRMSPEERRRAAAMEAQRVHRVQRRRERRRRRTVSMMGGMTRSFIIIIVSAILTATILAFWTDPDNLSADQRASVLQPAESTSGAVLIATPTALATPNYLLRIGIVSGHAGPENDPGAVCPDGLTEAEINRAVALRVVQNLRERGYNVDLLDEFDERLEGYEAAALVSIHSNDCTDYGEFVSGFLVSQAEARAEGGPDTRLRECVATSYGEGTNLDRRFGLTRDMTDYHIFRSIHPRTPGVIVELGFMLGDRELLTTQPDAIASSIVSGVLCFLETPVGEFVPTPDLVTLTPVPTDTPVSVP